jgi:uncharacterized protein (DUF342 family)
MLSDAISKVSAYVKVQERAVYEETKNFLIAESFEPVLTTNDALILHYDKSKPKDELDDNEKVDYSERGYINNVQKNELLIEYIKSEFGKPGRDCRGIYIKPSKPIVKNEPKFSVDDTIEVVETDKNIQYIATINGYITYSNRVYSIKTGVELKNISFKSTGSISAGLHSDVSVNVKETDLVKDAIGTGMEVEVSNIVRGKYWFKCKSFCTKS